MNVPTRLGAYGLGLALAFGAAVWTGSALGPAVPGATAEDPGNAEGEATSHQAATAGGHGGGEDASPPAEGHDSHAEEAGTGGVAGVVITAEGYTLVPLEAPEEADVEGELSFRITGPDGETVTGFTEEHERRMHLIVVGRDLAGYQHLHPEMGEDGTWSVPIEFATPGPYRMFADFVPEGHGDGLVLGADLSVPGDHRPAELPEPHPHVEVDGYEVELEGDLAPGEAGELTFTVSRDGEPVTDLEPYLGAYGHLVALRGGDLAFLHVHPREGAAGPEITFHAEVPSAGDYRLFLDFRHDGEVRTAEFTVRVDASGGLATGDHEETHEGDDGP